MKDVLVAAAIAGSLGAMIFGLAVVMSKIQDPNPAPCSSYGNQALKYLPARCISEFTK